MKPFNDFLKRMWPVAYALFRAVFGLLFTFHGTQKILGVLSDHPKPPLGSQIWFGGVIELVAGILIAIGLFTRCAAFIASGTMAVAYIQFHWRFQFGAAFLPAINQGELAVLYCFAFLAMATYGGGPLSVDGKRGAWTAPS